MYETYNASLASRRMTGQVYLSTHPDREKIENSLIEGANVMQIHASTGISTDALYRRRRQLLADKKSEKDVQEDLSRQGVVRRLQALAASHRTIRLQAEETGSARIATDAGVAERRVLGDLLALAPDHELEKKLRESDKQADALASALMAVLKTVKTSTAYQTAIAQLLEDGFTEEDVLPLSRAAESLGKASA
ncbi:hypothetical protein [Herbiconiux sp. VKM Ac-2851]|uniref:hypothetical protein n=1 Tax=Herbiconiux sp. VKM Ac-2851 TaxID=2739025 RepID=UPI00156724B8|nr:hypothetical protein [Herbiconiux sp. VKM Ac-2851]NQX33591.1 hypothetical protein [Herbiconiux sp. VKM Ac-2851]